MTELKDHQVIGALWADQPGRYACLSTKDTDGRWQDHFLDPDDCDLGEFIERHRDSNIYFCPHLFKARRRIKDNAVLPRALWADLDQVNPNKLGELEPTIAIESSPGRYATLWVTDKIVTEQLNKRLTYHVGADKGGWDLTQVLRLPGGINHKPQYDKPRVKLMWDDGPTYKVKDLEAKLPALDVSSAPRRRDRRVSSLTETEIFAKYRINGNLRDNLASDGRVAREQRRVNEWLDHPDRRMQSSKELHRVQRWRMHWKLACGLHEKGVSADDAFVLLVGCAWNKHSDESSVWRLVEKLWGDEDKCDSCKRN